MDDWKQSSTVVKLNDEEGVKRILSQTVLGLWSLVNNLTRLEPSRRERYRVTIFGSARPEPGHFVYEEVKRMSASFAELGCDIVTGGGPGLMRAANEGAAQAQHHDRPLIFVGPMWRELVAWIERSMLRPGFELISRQDLSIPQCVDTAEEASALIRASHARWRAQQDAPR